MQVSIKSLTFAPIMGLTGVNVKMMAKTNINISHKAMWSDADGSVSFNGLYLAGSEILLTHTHTHTHTHTRHPA